jgi:hypothetical protein
VRSGHGGLPREKVQNKISTDDMISAETHRQLHTTQHHPPASHLPVPGSCNSASPCAKHTAAYMGV